MNISQLEYFVTTVQCGSFSMAAKKLFVTPQAISKAVGDLERELHVDLCEKTGRAVEPTEFGRLFCIRASEVLCCLTDLESLAKDYAAGKSKEGRAAVSVACSPCRGNVLHAQDFSAFNASYPQIKLSLSFNAGSTGLSAVEEGLIDGAVILGRATKPNITCIKLHSVQPFLMVSQNHPLASRSAIHLEDLRKTPLAAPEDIRYCQGIIADHLRAKNVEPSYTMLEPFVEAHRRFLDKEHGAVFVIDDPTLQELYPNAVALPLAPEDAISIPLCFVHASGNANKAMLQVERYLLGIVTRLRRKPQAMPEHH
ncbi:LysR family transcriptional regulator [Paraeggerthella hongkongensis]|uniref:HTH lysR-type domain-containing protein n=1 Tax=Paraeggerthella hongkongensis TaxID=230658 RepID=A0A3N0ASX4_9ACTN|nr:LysR family transcriptional regulator [Paraeggerthella hongkongensis]RNL37972.1 hypothetical protein DMP08_12170 [Paraeggerthella hongkongensis]